MFGLSNGYLLLIVVTLAIGGLATWYVNSQLKKYTHVPISTGLTGAEAARRMLMYYGIGDVEVHRGGPGQDFFDPRTNSVTLSPDAYAGRSITAKAEAIGRLVSLALRSGVEVRDIVAQIKGIGGEHPVFRGKGLLLSIPDAIAWVLERRYLKDEHLGSGVADIEEHRCPECDEPLVFQEGCLICPACGFSRCG